jgi:hypothetical protein
MKYRRLGWSMVWVEIGVVPWLAAMLMLYKGYLDGTG